MWLVENDVEVPKCWEHDPDIRNKYGDSVGILIARKGIVPPE